MQILFPKIKDTAAEVLKSLIKCLISTNTGEGEVYLKSFLFQCLTKCKHNHKHWIQSKTKWMQKLYLPHLKKKK